MKKLKRLAWILIIMMFAQIIPINTAVVFADKQAEPTNLAVQESSIGYSVASGYYATLTWTKPVWQGDNQFYVLFYKKDGAAVYQQYGTNIPDNATSIQMKGLDAGTVYHAYIEAVHEHYNTNGVVTSTDVSGPSNEVIFMTDFQLAVNPGADSALNITWTDVYYNSARIAYNLYISESASFGQTAPIYIDDTKVGTGNVVTSLNGKLTYCSTDLKPGTVYYVKIEPLITDSLVEFNTVSKTVCGYTYIIATISKVSSSWWILQWNAITNSNLGDNAEIIYKIKRSINGDLEKETSGTNDTQMYVKVAGTNVYYKIEADVVTELDEPLTLTSEKIYVSEGGVPATPSVPEIVDELSDQEMTVGNNSIKILWKAPYTATGELDEDMEYDLWVLQDPDKIDDNTIAATATDISANKANYVYELSGLGYGNTVLGFKYTITGLTPNTTYYIKMVAKKKYISSVDGTVVSNYYYSEPALKEISTLSDGSTVQPIAPSAPPFCIKTTNGSQVVDSDGVTLQWKNQWYEIWNGTDGKWEYATSAEAEAAAANGEVNRYIKYDDDVYFGVGYEVYTNDFDFTRLSETVTSMPIQFTNIANSTTSDTINFEATGLSPNTTYVMWVRAYKSNSVKSELSDPILVTTKPQYQTPIIKPTIPAFTSTTVGDTYVDLGWDINKAYNYTIVYATSDNISTPLKTTELTPTDLADITEYEVTGLTPETTYYFWIRAGITNNGTTTYSEWSDSYTLTTKAYLAPDVPEGFGLKSVTNPIGSDYIYYEWMKVEGLEYTLELAKKPDFSDAVIYSAGAVSEYKETGLSANTTYYARLSAYNPTTKLTSDYSATVIAITSKNQEEYYSDIDLGTYTAEKVKPTLGSNSMGILDATKENADIFIKQIEEGVGASYTVDFSNLTTNEMVKSETNLSSRVLVALQQMKKNLVLDNGKALLIIKPELINSKQIKQIYSISPSFNADIIFEKYTTSITKPMGSTQISDQWKVTLNIDNGDVQIPISNLTNVASIGVVYTTSTWYDKNTMAGYSYNEGSKAWVKRTTTNTFNTDSNEGHVYSDIPGTCIYAVLKSSSGRFSDISGSAYESDINDIVNNYDVKSLTGTTFEPNRDITKAEAVKMILDILGSDYGDNFMDIASKAKITADISTSNSGGSITRRQAASMLVRTYTIITGETIQSSTLLKGFANPDTSAARGEFMRMMKVMLDN